ncbi:glycogen synthase [Sorangium cellulosum]|uniref:Glycogen synthase n=1 Tax=Sorangium cellulosum TaxID=56 RepID=A0A4P2PXP2_SORCE|nr:glycosyltransferase [Sorangium cellulosum]AUX21589.1 glycogen synthase [Sorangium cellulosum]
MEPCDVYGAASRGRTGARLACKLAIAHVVSSLKVGGAEQVVVDLATLQRAAGHDVVVIAISDDPDGPRAEQLRRRGVEVQLLPKRRGFDVSITARLVSRFAAWGTSLVHVHNLQPLLYAAPAGWLHRAPVIHTRHGVVDDPRARPWLRHAAAAFVDAHVAVSRPTAEVMLSEGQVTPPKLHVVTNGVDLSRFAPDPVARARVRAELGISQQAWVVGTVGRLAPVKDHALLLRAAARALPGDGRLLLVGDGPERAPLVALARELGLSERALFLGERHGVPRILAALDAFALSSLSEGLPLAVLEAMAAGLPVVATAVGGVPTAVTDGLTGFLVPSGDTEALEARLTHLRDDPALATRMGRNGRKVALQRYSAARMVERYMDLYTLLLVRQHPRGKPTVRPSALVAHVKGASAPPRELGPSAPREAADRGEGAPRGGAAAGARPRSPTAPPS